MLPGWRKWERLNLIGELWDSIDVESVPLPPTQVAELDRRIATLDDDIQHGQTAEEAILELRGRYR